MTGQGRDPAFLAVRDLTKRFGGLTAVSEATFDVREGSITGLIGPNGAGKTTLFAMIAGFEQPSAGLVLLDGEEITGRKPHDLAKLGLARTFQIVQPFAGLSVRENIAVGAFLRLPKRGDALALAEEVGQRLGLGPQLDKPAAALTVAGRKRLEVARFMEDLTASNQGGWYSVISLHGGGSPEAMKREIWRNYPVEERSALVERLLDRGILDEGKRISKQPGRCCDTGCEAPRAPAIPEGSFIGRAAE